MQRQELPQSISLIAAIRNQLDFYFSFGNLSKDAFMLSNCDHIGFIPVAIMAAFPKIRALGGSTDDVVRAASSSHICEFSPECGAIRARWMNGATQLVMRALPPKHVVDALRPVFVKAVGDGAFVFQFEAPERVAEVVRELERFAQGSPSLPQQQAQQMQVDPAAVKKSGLNTQARAWAPPAFSSQPVRGAYGAVAGAGTFVSQSPAASAPSSAPQASTGAKARAAHKKMDARAGKGFPQQRSRQQQPKKQVSEASFGVSDFPTLAGKAPSPSSERAATVKLDGWLAAAEKAPAPAPVVQTTPSRARRVEQAATAAADDKLLDEAMLQSQDDMQSVPSPVALAAAAVSAPPSQQQQQPQQPQQPQQQVPSVIRKRGWEKPGVPRVAPRAARVDVEEEKASSDRSSEKSEIENQAAPLVSQQHLPAPIPANPAGKKSFADILRASRSAQNASVARASAPQAQQQTQPSVRKPLVSSANWGDDDFIP